MKKLILMNNNVKLFSIFLLFIWKYWIEKEIVLFIIFILFQHHNGCSSCFNKETNSKFLFTIWLNFFVIFNYYVNKINNQKKNIYLHKYPRLIHKNPQFNIRLKILTQLKAISRNSRIFRLSLRTEQTAIKSSIYFLFFFNF